MMLRVFFYLIGPSAFSAICIYLLDARKRPECSFGLGLNGFMKHFVLGVQLPLPTVYMRLNRWPQAFSETPDQYFLVTGRNGVKFPEHGLQMFQVCWPVHDVFLFVLSISFDFTPETMHKDCRIAKVVA